MIKFDLLCPKEHRFEGWFRNNAEYDSQKAGRKIACPVCASRRIKKAPMAPAIAGTRRSDKTDPSTDSLTQLKELQTYIESNAEHVGERFPEEVRKMHYGEIKKRNIYGDASDSETRELVEEGINIARIPWLPRHDS
ncbi:MAG: DUF1178 family protein [Alphaproteobacteria bacterium]